MQQHQASSLLPTSAQIGIAVEPLEGIKQQTPATNTQVSITYMYWSWYSGEDPGCFLCRGGGGGGTIIFSWQAKNKQQKYF